MTEKARLFTDLEMLGIPIGAELTFAKDESQTCIVVAQYWPEVAFKNELMSLTRAMELIAPSMKGNAMEQWMYEGETDLPPKESSSSANSTAGVRSASTEMMMTASIHTSSSVCELKFKKPFQRILGRGIDHTTR